MAVTGYRTGLISGALAMALVGSSAAVSPLLTDYPVLAGQAWRYTAAAFLLLGYLWLRRLPWVRVGRSDWVRLALLAATGLAAFNVCLLQAARYTDPPVLGAIVGAAPLVLAISGPLLAGRRPSPLVATSAVIVVVGVGIVLGGGHFSLPGVLWSLGALAGECLFSLLAVPLLPRLGPVRVSAYTCALAGVMLAVAALLVERGDVATVPTGVEVLSLAFLAVFVTAVAFALWYAAVGSLGVDRAGLLAGLVPVAATLIAVGIDTTTLSLQVLLGAVLVGAGVSLGMLPPRRRPGGGAAGHEGQRPASRRSAPVEQVGGLP
ncbi:DMT family transporter [Verrucosispora sp. WMMD573]|uniref:DMT family transporter n=1 Tax=Verrucosispora sp. WMMD573 TaxID=3015149 RepID=UPI00248CFB38|nr:DMT family transporter [Verrucosispora sp. WMMD573]WBB54086.1 DMT family transporter [Verrucosispora sp. WMMD573]